MEELAGNYSEWTRSKYRPYTRDLVDAQDAHRDSLEGEEVRGQVIYALSRNEDAAAVDALMEIATSETDVELRQQAVYWLGRSSDPRAAEFLMRLIRGGR